MAIMIIKTLYFFLSPKKLGLNWGILDHIPIIDNFGLPFVTLKSYEECEEHCQRDERCTMFEWRKGNKCYLKNEAAALKRKVINMLKKVSIFNYTDEMNLFFCASRRVWLL